MAAATTGEMNGANELAGERLRNADKRKLLQLRPPCIWPTSPESAAYS